MEKHKPGEKAKESGQYPIREHAEAIPAKRER